MFWRIIVSIIVLVLGILVVFIEVRIVVRMMMSC